MTESEVRNDLFEPIGLDRGRSRLWEAAWYATKMCFFLSAFPWPSSMKRRVLQLFGAQIGRGFYIRPRVNIHFPWKLRVGDHCWIGEGCEILNLEPVVMEDHSALAHEVYLATGNHDIRSRTMRYKNAQIVIKHGAWLGSRSFINAGITIAPYAVVAAGAVVVKDVNAYEIVGGNPAQVIGKRDIRNE